MMVVKVEQIREDGLQLDEPVEQTFLAEALGEGDRAGEFHARGASALRAKLQKVSGGVLVKGEMTAPLTAPCKRCLKDVTLDLGVSFMLNLVPSHPGAAANEDEANDEETGDQAGSFDLTDADQEPFDGKTIDLRPIVREQVLLALPMSVLCREDCPGLCPVCGQDWNVKSCECDRHVPDPRLAALKNIKLS